MCYGYKGKCVYSIRELYPHISKWLLWNRNLACNCRPNIPGDGGVPREWLLEAPGTASSPFLSTLPTPSSSTPQLLDTHPNTSFSPHLHRHYRTSPGNFYRSPSVYSAWVLRSVGCRTRPRACKYICIKYVSLCGFYLKYVHFLHVYFANIK